MGYIGPSQYIGSGGATRQDMEMFVNESGNDTTGDGSASNPFRNPQVAINKVNKLIGNYIKINVAAGDYNGYAVGGFQQSSGNGLFEIEGTLGAPTLSGKTSGTATGGSTLTLIDTNTPNWAVNEVRGKLVLIDSTYRTVLSNTADTLYFYAPFGSSTSGKDYSILESKTNINTVESEYFDYSPILVYGNQNVNSGFLQIKNFNIIKPSNRIGFWLYESSGMRLINTSVSGTGGAEAITFQGCHSEYSIREVFSDMTNCTSFGLNLLFCTGWGRTVRAGVYNASNHSIKIQSCRVITDAQVGIDESTQNGLHIYKNSNQIEIQRADISNCNNGVFTENTFVKLSNLSGSGNVFGLNSAYNSFVRISGIPTITGTSGEATINGGVDVIDWSDTFPSNGDIAKNEDNLSVIVRDD